MPDVNKWIITSNNGGTVLQFEVEEYLSSSETFRFCTTLSSRSYELEAFEHYDRYGELPEKSRITLNSIKISKSACLALIEHFTEWLAAQNPFDCILHESYSGLIQLSMERRGHSVLIPQHWIVFRYVADNFKIEEGLLIDQSCIRIARNQLHLLINSFEA